MVTTQEVQPTATDVAPDASGQLNQNGYGELNQGTDATGAYSAGIPGEAASDEGEVNTEDEIDPEIVQRVLAKREMEIRSKIDPELRRFNTAMQKNLARNTRETRTQLQTQRDHVIERLTELGIDPKELQLEVLDAKQINAREQARQLLDEGERVWARDEPGIEAAFGQFLEEKGFNPATGQWVVDPNDPELMTLKQRAIDVAQRWTFSGMDDERLRQQSNDLGNQWRALVMQKAKAKAATGSGTPPSQPRQQQPSQQQKALAAAATRGPVIAGRPGGGSAPVTFDDYFAQAKAEMPTSSYHDQIVRATELKIIAKESQRK